MADKANTKPGIRNFIYLRRGSVCSNCFNCTVMDIMDVFNFSSWHWGNLAKAFTAVAASLVPIAKIRSFFSDYRTRSRLKSDLEIFRLVSDNSIDGGLIKDRIDKTLKSLYRTNKKPLLSSFSNVLGGLVWVIGFGWWTISIYNESSQFSPWMLATGFAAAIGFTTIFQRESKKKDEKKRKEKIPVFSITVYNWQHIISTIFVIGVLVASTIGIYWSLGLSPWHLLTVSLGIGGILHFFQQVEIKSGSDFNPEDYH